jgi:hypothetical protein
MKRISMSNQRPIMNWNSQNAHDADGKIVWWSRLGGRYQVEVQREGRRIGSSCIFDHDADDLLVHAVRVTLAYGAPSGLDVQDVEQWRQIAVKLIGSRQA